MKPRYRSGRAPSSGCDGSASSAKFTFELTPWNFRRRMSSTRSSGSSRGSTSSRKVRRGSSALTTTSARDLGPVGEGHAGSLAVAGQDALHRRLGPNLCAERLRRAGQHLGEAAVAALVEGPRAELAVVLTEGVEEQHEP